MVLVQAHGTFDGLHPGHLAYLEAARKLGDALIVTVTADKYVRKGVARPLFPEAERLAMLNALKCVHIAILSDHYGAEHAIRAVGPSIYVKGKEYEGRLPEAALCERLGIKVVYLDTKPVYSSTRLLSGEELNARIRATGAGN